MGGSQEQKSNYYILWHTSSLYDFDETYFTKRVGTNIPLNMLKKENVIQFEESEYKQLFGNNFYKWESTYKIEIKCGIFRMEYTRVCLHAKDKM